MLQNYLTLAFRNLRKHRVFALLNILGLGCCIACCMVIFLLVRHHLSFDRFHAKADRTAVIVTETRREGVEKKTNLVPYPMSEALRQEYSFLEKTAMVSSRQNTLITIAEPGQAPVKFKDKDSRAFAEPELFQIFDFPLVQGDLNSFREPLTALMTEKMARKFYGTTDVLGKTFKVNNRLDFRVVGVLQDIPENTDLQYQLYCSWATLVTDSMSMHMVHNWGGIQSGTQCFAVFREGHPMDELEQAFGSFREKYFHPEVRNWYYHPIPLKTVHLNAELGAGISQRYLWTLGLIGLFLLLTACVNFVNMATAQALNRAREVGVRKTMGSTRSQLFWQFMSETGLIVGMAMLIGLGFAHFALPYLNRLTGTALAFSFTHDGSLYGFLAALALVITFLSGAYPGLAMSGFRPAQSLKGPVDARQVGGFSLRRLLVATQFAISQALIIGAVVITAQIDYARKADLGFRREGILTLPLPGGDYGKVSTLKQQLGSLAGVESVSGCMQPPASDNNWNTQLQLQGRPEREPWNINFKFVDDHFAETFGLQFVAGRNLLASDTVREYIVNETTVKRLGLSSPQDIIGQQLSVDGFPRQVVGVVRDFHNLSFHEAIAPMVLASDITNYDVCAVRIDLHEIKATLAAIEKTWTGIYPEYYYEYAFMDPLIAKFYEQEATILQLISLFAGIAIFIGCLGLYGLAAFLVMRKTKEIGIRKTLGASIAGIMWLFGREYARLIVIAFVIAAPIAWWAMNIWLQDYQYRITMHAGIFAISLLATFALASLTVGVQSIRAALANLVKSLRSE